MEIMEKLEKLTMYDTSGEILSMLGDGGQRRTTAVGKGTMTKYPARTSADKPLTEISDFISKRKAAYEGELDTNNIYRRHLALRLDDYIVKPNSRISSLQKERPLSEFSLKNDWQKRNWDVKPIKKSSVPPNSPQSPNRKMDWFEPSMESPKFGRKKPKRKRKENIKGEETGWKTAAERTQPFARGDASISGKTPGTNTCPLKSEKRSQSPDAAQLSWTPCFVTHSELSAPGWGSRTLDKRFLEQAAKELIDLSEVGVRY